jgi:hypothetical protein
VFGLGESVLITSSLRVVHNTRKIGEVWAKRDTILEQVQFWSLVYGASVYFLTERNSSLAFLRGGNGHDCFD